MGHISFCPFTRDFFEDRFGYPRVARDVASARRPRDVDRGPEFGRETQTLARAVINVFDHGKTTHEPIRRQFGAKNKNLNRTRP